MAPPTGFGSWQNPRSEFKSKAGRAPLQGLALSGDDSAGQEVYDDAPEGSGDVSQSNAFGQGYQQQMPPGFGPQGYGPQGFPQAGFWGPQVPLGGNIPQGLSVTPSGVPVGNAQLLTGAMGIVKDQQGFRTSAIPEDWDTLLAAAVGQDLKFPEGTDKKDVMTAVSTMINSKGASVMKAIAYKGFDGDKTLMKVAMLMSTKGGEDVAMAITVLLSWYVTYGPAIGEGRLQSSGMASLVVKAVAMLDLAHGQRNVPEALTIQRLVAVFPEEVIKMRDDNSRPSAGVVLIEAKRHEKKRGEEKEELEGYSERVGQYVIKDNGVTIDHGVFCSPEGPYICDDALFKLWLTWARKHHETINRGKGDRKPPFNTSIPTAKMNSGKVSQSIKGVAMAAIKQSLSLMTEHNVMIALVRQV
jgi:hypothetical protein